MDYCTDTFSFNRSPMFGKIRNGLPIDKSYAQNILDTHDDILFAWNSKSYCLQVMNWRLLKEKKAANDRFQTLTMSKQQNFVVNKILCSIDGAYVAVAGNRGCTVLTLPPKTGPQGLFKLGEERILCKSENLEERLFNNNPNLEIVQVRWHPASLTDSHLLVLLSDNTIRVYDDSQLRHVWRVGPMLRSVSADTPLPQLQRAEEGVIDFDIAPPKLSSDLSTKDPLDSTISIMETSLIVSKNNSKKQTRHVEWPIVTLRGNGCVYIVCAGLDTPRPTIQGPVTMMPKNETNFGNEASSILVIPSFPPTVVISECNGNIHHTLLFDDLETPGTSLIKNDLLVPVVFPSQYTLHVIETVELELGLPASRKNYVCPIHLRRDPVNELRYYVYHDTGLHAVSIKFLKELEDFIKAGHSESLPSFSTPSGVEYIVCTATEKAVNPVLGFTIFQMPAGILLLLANGQCFSLNINTIPHILRNWVIDYNSKVAYESPFEKQLSDPFQEQIYNILKGDVNQPLLSLTKSSAESNLKESYEILTQAIETIKSKILPKHEMAREKIVERLVKQKLFREQQERELAELEKQREEIRENAERLADKCEDISDKLQKSFQQCLELLRKTNIYLPSRCMSDEKFVQKLKTMQQKAVNMAKTLEITKQRLNSREEHISEDYRDNNKKKVYLPAKQESVIKQSLFDLSLEIQNLIVDIKDLKKRLNFKKSRVKNQQKQEFQTEDASTPTIKYRNKKQAKKSKTSVKQ